MTTGIFKGQIREYKRQNDRKRSKFLENAGFYAKNDEWYILRPANMVSTQVLSP